MKRVSEENPLLKEKGEKSCYVWGQAKEVTEYVQVNGGTEIK